jgi:hypothetical protein
MSLPVDKKENFWEHQGFICKIDQDMQLYNNFKIIVGAEMA